MDLKIFIKVLLENPDEALWSLLPLLFLFSIYLSFSNKETAHSFCSAKQPTWLHNKWLGLTADWAVMLALWLPMESGLVVKLAMKFIGPDADDAQMYWELFALVIGLIYFLSFRKYDIHYHLWSKKLNDWKEALRNFGILIPPLLIMGLHSGFITYSGLPSLSLRTLFIPIGIFFIVAVPEEIFFRGIMQKSLGKVMSDESANAFTAVLFGLAHYTNSSDPLFACQYVYLATIAGYVYGKTYQNTKSIFPAAVVHTLVDTVWVLFFLTPNTQ
ncbi:MAG: CPBP family intramembrane metalloprotease [bacterium]|nr:CPBP family intramembrane metalloprotease [bacterium]